MSHDASKGKPSRSALQRRERASVAAALTDCGHLACLGMRRCREGRK